MELHSLKRLALLLAGASFALMSAGCQEGAEITTVSPIATTGAQGLPAGPQSNGVVANTISGQRYKMTFVVGGNTPPQAGGSHKLNVPTTP